MKAWLTRTPNRWLALLLLAACSYGLVQLYKEFTMPPPLVYLIPEDYFGPVFVFFGQEDGVDVQPDPLGNSVWVPENGVVKVKQKTSEVLGNSREGYRATYTISISKHGERKVMKVHGSAERDENGIWKTYYFDENTRLHEFPAGSEIGKPRFYYFTEAEKNERMVFNHDGCAHQFSSDNESNGKSPACGKFLVVSPNEYLNLPIFMWRELQHPYSSIQQFVNEANERIKKKKEYYHLPAQEEQVSQVESGILRAKAGTPCPRSGIWQSQDTKAEQRYCKEGESLPDLGSAYGLTVWQWVR